MNSYEFLKEQFENVARTLSETLRYDYGPESTRKYYQECLERLNRIGEAIKKVGPSQPIEIQDRLEELSKLSVWISLIERSRLGEFSWPFAEALRTMAEALLADSNLLGTRTPPIVHIISDGEGYFIHYERRSPSTKNKFAFIAFPKPLKHHVLLHTLFGHELGHTALHTVGPGSILQSEVIPALQSAGPLSSTTSFVSWIHSGKAPSEVRAEVGHYLSSRGTQYQMADDYLLSWIDEIICDLFGLLLFGPGFAAAHQTFLRPTQANPYELFLEDPTHPPYAIRQRVLTSAMKRLAWQKPIISTGANGAAEQKLLDFIFDDPFDPWCSILNDKQLDDAIAAIKKVLQSYGTLDYRDPSESDLSKLVSQLVSRLPPIAAELSDKGEPALRKTNISHTLYAGWIYAVGHAELTKDPLTFLEANMLCDQALLQERAISIMIAGKVK